MQNYFLRVQDSKNRDELRVHLVIADLRKSKNGAIQVQRSDADFTTGFTSAFHDGHDHTLLNLRNGGPTGASHVSELSDLRPRRSCRSLARGLNVVSAIL